MEVRETITIDETNRKILMEIDRAIKEFQRDIRLVCNTLINAKGGSGNYDISPDFSRLIPQEEKPCQTLPS